jgi:MoxR-like ATPase
MSLDLSKYKAENMGLHGLEDEFKLCHIPFLVVNDVYGAVALEGSSGSAKTTLIDRIGKLNQAAGGGAVGIFSADKARYEDFIGCPIPNLETNEMQIYPMPNSVTKMETLLIDEINRASYENQEKWLSLLSSRKVDGHKTACRYLFAAMNPVQGENGDQYDGTQPLDKALGERIMLLIQMPKFSDLSAKDKIKVMTACRNQVHWVPTEEYIELHKEFLRQARELYDGYKETLTEKVANYICTVESNIKKESKDNNKSLRLEGRRAQFILTNIIANHALNKVFYGSSSLEKSALEALYKSFPNILWQDAINTVALKVAHDSAKDILNMEEEERMKSAKNYEGLTGPLKKIKKAANDGQNLESISKLVVQEWPDKNLDPINHYVFAIAANSGFEKKLEDSKPVVKKN